MWRSRTRNWRPWLTVSALVIFIAQIPRPLAQDIRQSRYDVKKKTLNMIDDFCSESK
jgi:hypothetical protein